MKEFRFWWAFSCWFTWFAKHWFQYGADCFKVKRGIFGQLFINQPFGKYHIVDFASNSFRNFNVILKRGEVENPFKHATSCVFYAILYRSWMVFNNKSLVALHEREHKALYLTWKVLKNSKDGNEILLSYGTNKEHYFVANGFLVLRLN